MMSGNKTHVRRKIDLNKRYVFPQNIKEISYKGYYLIISVETAKWIVIKNSSQYDFYKLLREITLAEALCKYTGSEDDAKYVITQIEGRHFTETEVESCIDYDKQVLHVYLTNSCNLRCPHCYMYAGKKMEQELSTAEIKAMLHSYGVCGGKNITFSGGEISLRTDLLEIVQYAYSEGLNIRLLSNGTLWNKGKIDFISPFINSVQISVDGYDETSNSKIRGKDSFGKSLAAIDYFIQNNVPTEIAITPWFDDDLELKINQYAQFAKELSHRYKGKQFNIKFAHQVLEGREVKLSTDQQKCYSDIIDRIYSLYYDQETKDYSFIALFSTPKIMDNCMYGELSIAANGDVYFCSRIPSTTPIANIRNTPFEDILELSKTAQQKSNISNLKPCRDCELKYICGGGCRLDYFPTFASCDDVISMEVENFQPRICNEKEKEMYYDLMIKTNDKLLS